MLKDILRQVENFCRSDKGFSYITVGILMLGLIIVDLPIPTLSKKIICFMLGLIFAELFLGRRQ